MLDFFNRFIIIGMIWYAWTCSDIFSLFFFNQVAMDETSGQNFICNLVTMAQKVQDQ